MTEATLEQLAHGNAQDLIGLPDQIVQHGDNVYMVIGWDDPNVDPDLVAAGLQRKMELAGFIPAEGESVMAIADPDHLRVNVNYKEQTPDFGILASLVVGLGIGGTLGFIVARNTNFLKGTEGTETGTPVTNGEEGLTLRRLMPFLIVGGLLLAGGVAVFLFSGRRRLAPARA